jgi:hypothetical protein
VELAASAASAYLLTGIIPRIGSTATFDFEVDVGTGGAGSETVIATVSGRSDAVLGGIGAITRIGLPIPVDNIASSARIATRIRKSDTNTTAWNIAIQLAAKPITGSLLTTAHVSKVQPSAAAHLDVATGGSAWVSGSWVQLVASTSAAWVIWGVSVYNVSSGDCEIDIGTGGAGSEVVIDTIRSGGAAGRAWWISKANPLSNIASSVRVAIRSRRDTTPNNIKVSVTYFELPL